jgi:hypothetical protein
MVSVLIEKLLDTDNNYLLLTNSGNIYEVKKMERKSFRIKYRFVLFCLVLAVFGIIVLGYYCQDQVSLSDPVAGFLRQFYYP